MICASSIDSLVGRRAAAREGHRRHRHPVDAAGRHGGALPARRPERRYQRRLDGTRLPHANPAGHGAPPGRRCRRRDRGVLSDASSGRAWPGRGRGRRSAGGGGSPARAGVGQPRPGRPWAHRRGDTHAATVRSRRRRGTPAARPARVRSVGGRQPRLGGRAAARAGGDAGAAGFAFWPRARTSCAACSCGWPSAARCSV